MPSLENPRRLTELEAVNIILKNSGEAPVVSLGHDARYSAQKARDTLAEQSVLVQSDGWNFCTEWEMVLEPDGTTREIILPVNILSFHPVGRSAHMNLHEEDNRLYDARERTFQFTHPVTLEAILAKPFDRLPQPARWHITVGAALRYANAENPGGANLRLTVEDLTNSEAALKRYDRRLRKGGLRIHNPHFQRLRGRR